MRQPEETNAEEGEQEDRLSSLPDDILAHILTLCLLPSNTLVATTSILSHRWRYVWTRLPKVKCQLVVRDRIDRCVFFTWIAKFISFGINELTIDCLGYDDRYLPDEIFRCESLEKLILGRRMEFDPKEINLPNLKVLSLHLNNNHHHLMPVLFKSFPLLEELQLFCNFKDNNNNKKKTITYHTIDICSAHLNLLRITLSSTENKYKYRYSSYGEDGHMICINAPRLEKLLINDKCGYVNYYMAEIPMFLVEAELSIRQIDDSNSKRLLDATLSVGSLKIHAQVLKITSSCSWHFLNLTSLEVTYPGSSSIITWATFESFMEHCPNMEVLTLNFGIICDYQEIETVGCLFRKLTMLNMVTNVKHWYYLARIACCFMGRAQALKCISVVVVDFRREVTYSDKESRLHRFFSELFASPGCCEGCEIKFSDQCGLDISFRNFDMKELRYLIRQSRPVPK